MIMRLHDELNGIDNNLIKQNNLTPPAIQLNPYDNNLTLFICSYLDINYFKLFLWNYPRRIRIYNII